MHLHVCAFENLVEVGSAFLAVIFVWRYGFVRQSHTATVLPYVTVVALDKKVPYVVGYSCLRRQIIVHPIHNAIVKLTCVAKLLPYASTGTRILGMTTNAACNIIFYSIVLILLD